MFIIKISSGGYDACFLGQLLNPFSFETPVFVVTSFPINVVFTSFPRLCISKEVLKETVASPALLSLAQLTCCSFFCFLMHTELI